MKKMKARFEISSRFLLREPGCMLTYLLACLLSYNCCYRRCPAERLSSCSSTSLILKCFKEETQM